MKWQKTFIIATVILLLLLVFITMFVAAIRSEDIRRTVGLTQIPEWAPSHDPNETNNNYTYRVLLKYYNNASNLTSPFFNSTINFTLQMENLGINTTLNTLANRSVRIYEINSRGGCINESGVANGTCTSFSWGTIE